MQHDKTHFNLEELDVNKFKKIDYNISAGGSNKSKNTIVWYFNLLKIKTKFNSEAMSLPIIIDSPTNAELEKIVSILCSNIYLKNLIRITN